MAATDEKIQEDKTEELNIVSQFPKAKWFEIRGHERKEVFEGSLKVGLVTLNDEEHCLLTFSGSEIRYALNKNLPSLRATHYNYVFPGENVSFGLRLMNSAESVEERLKFDEHVEMFDQMLELYSMFQVGQSEQTSKKEAQPSVVDKLKEGGIAALDSASAVVGVTKDTGKKVISSVFGSSALSKGTSALNFFAFGVKSASSAASAAAKSTVNAIKPAAEVMNSVAVSSSEAVKSAAKSGADVGKVALNKTSEVAKSAVSFSSEAVKSIANKTGETATSLAKDISESSVGKSVIGTSASVGAAVGKAGAKTVEKTAKVAGTAYSGAKVVAESAVPSDESVVKTSKSLVRKIDDANTLLKNTIESSSNAARKRIEQGRDLLKRKVGKKKDIDLSDTTVERIHNMKELAVSVSTLSSAVLLATIHVGNSVARGVVEAAFETKPVKAILKSEPSDEPSSPKPKTDAMRRVALAGTKAFLEISAKLLDASFQLTEDIESASVDIVTHKYGEEVGQALENTIEVVESANLVRRQMRGLAVKGLAKKAAKAAAKETVEEYIELQEEAENELKEKEENGRKKINSASKC